MSHALVTPGTASLDQPLYGATIGQAAARFFKKYATFTGRASRSEYWWWVLVNVIISGVLYGVALSTSDLTNPAGPQFGAGMWVYGLWVLVTVIPGLALSIRRLHDTNRSGWMILLGLIPLAGAIILIVFYVSEPVPAGQRFDR